MLISFCFKILTNQQFNLFFCLISFLHFISFFSPRFYYLLCIKGGKLLFSLCLEKLERLLKPTSLPDCFYTACENCRSRRAAVNHEGSRLFLLERGPCFFPCRGSKKKSRLGTAREIVRVSILQSACLSCPPETVDSFSFPAVLCASNGASKLVYYRKIYDSLGRLTILKNETLKCADPFLSIISPLTNIFILISIFRIRVKLNKTGPRNEFGTFLAIITYDDYKFLNCS